MMPKDRKGELHFEVLLKEYDQQYEYFPRASLEAEVSQWLQSSLLDQYQSNTDVEVPSCLEHAHLIQSIRVADASGPPNPDDRYNIQTFLPVVHAYELHELEGNDRQSRQDTAERMIELPSRNLAGIWDSLMFETIDPSQTLRSISRSIALMKRPGLNLNVLKLNRLVLLNGPPGCGKTSLCRGLTQKLSIRLGAFFASSRLFEMNTQSLLSKYYSESGRLVTQMFERITSLSQDQTTLFCVLIDEVESIAGSREHFSESGECHDSVRATNQLLTALDRICTRPNVVIFCTTNLRQAIDPAFLDRVDHEVSIPSPCESAVYEILRSTINELMRCNLITPLMCDVPETVLHNPDDRVFIPDYGTLERLEEYPNCQARVVAALAHRCKGFSGRKLRKLPLLAITRHTWGENCPLDDVLDAMSRVLDLDPATEENVALD